MDQPKPGKTETTTLDGRGLYLYCFARPGAVCTLYKEGPPGHIHPGIDGRHGIAEVEINDVAAVFSTVPLSEFTGESAQHRLQDLSWVGPRACRHDEVVREVMRRSPVLPVRFGAVFSEPQALVMLMAQHGKEILCFLDEVADKEEWSLKGFLDEAKAERWLIQTEPALAGEQQQLPASPGTRYFYEKRLHAEAQTRLRPWRTALADRVRDALKEGGMAEGEAKPPQGAAAAPLRALCALKIQPRSVTRRTADMIFHHAVLVQRGGIGKFQGQVAEIASAYAEQGLTVEVSGPWPPHNFCPTIGGMQT